MLLFVWKLTLSCDFYCSFHGGQQNVTKLVAKAMFWFIGKLECGTCNVLLQGILGAKSSKVGFFFTNIKVFDKQGDLLQISSYPKSLKVIWILDMY